MGSLRDSADEQATAATDEQATTATDGQTTTATDGQATTATDGLSFRPHDGVDNPVLTAAAVTDFDDPHFVADPFLLEDRDGTLHLFFEVYHDSRTPTAAIGHATSADAGHSWSYDRIVLEEPLHLSFPYVFRHAGDYYMLPDKWGESTVGTIDLYRAASFPGDWRQVATLVDPDEPLHDCVTVRWDGRWWAIAGDGRNLQVFSSERLVGDDWLPHPDNPVVTDRPRAARPGGRPLVGQEGIVLFLQDCLAQYGDSVRAVRIETLTETDYEDEEIGASPVLEASDGVVGWNSGRMHHVDPQRTAEGWLCAVDGNVNVRAGLFGKYHWSIGLYTLEAPDGASVGTPAGVRADAQVDAEVDGPAGARLGTPVDATAGASADTPTGEGLDAPGGEGGA